MWNIYRSKGLRLSGSYPATELFPFTSVANQHSFHSFQTGDLTLWHAADGGSGQRGRWENRTAFLNPAPARMPGNQITTILLTPTHLFSLQFIQASQKIPIWAFPPLSVLAFGRITANGHLHVRKSIVPQRCFLNQMQSLFWLLCRRISLIFY